MMRARKSEEDCSDEEANAEGDDDDEPGLHDRLN